MDEEIRSLLSFANVPENEAESNISHASQLGIHPDSFAQMSEPLKKSIELENLPKNVPDYVASIANQSTNHASLMKRDLAALNETDSFLGLLGSAFEDKNDDRELMKIYAKKVRTGNLSDEEDFRATELEYQLSQRKKPSDFGYSWWQTYPIDVMVGVKDSLGVLWDNKELIGTAFGVGAVGGGAVGLLGGPAAAVATGLSTGATAASWTALGVTAYDTYEQTSGQLYSALKNNIQDNSPMAEDERRTLAQGGAIAATLIQLPALGYVAKQVPFLKNLLDPRKSPAATLLFKDRLKAIARSGFVEGLEESAQETIQLLTEELGKTWNGKETDFFDAVQRVGQNYKENAVRVAKAGAVGAGAGAVFGTGGQLIDAGITKLRGEVPSAEAPAPETQQPENSPKVQEAKDLTSRLSRTFVLKSTLDLLRAKTKGLNLNKLPVDQVETYYKEAYKRAGISDVYVDVDAIGKWADNQEKADLLNSLLTPEQREEARLKAPLRFEPYVWQKAVEQYPELSNFAKADSHGPSMTDWVNHIGKQKLKESDVQAHLAEKVPVPAEQMPHVSVVDENIYTQEDYESQGTFTDAMYKTLPKKEILDFNEAMVNIRTKVSDLTLGKIDAEVEKIVSMETELNLLHEKEIVKSEIESDDNIKLVEDFIGEKRNLKIFGKEEQKKVKTGEPTFQINPDTLPEGLKKKYIKNKKINDRKIFSENGSDAKVVAGIYGKSVSEFLNILAKTPTMEEKISEKVNESEAEIRQETEDLNEPIKQDKISEAFDSTAKLHYEELKLFKNKYWSAFKKGIKRVALPMTSLEGLAERAKLTVGKTKIKDLNVQKWVVAERFSNREAINAVLKSEMENAFRNKENAVASIQLAKETYQAKKVVKKIYERLAKASLPEKQSTLLKAGRSYVDAYNFFMDVYGFDLTKKNLSKSDAYTKFAEKMEREGRGNFEIPPEVHEWLSDKTSPEDLTFDQLKYIDTKIRQVFHQAEMKNRLLQKNELRTVDLLANEIHESLKEKTYYDETKANEDVGGFNLIESARDTLLAVEDLVKNREHIIQQADGGALGVVNETISRPLEEGLARKADRDIKFFNHLKEQIKKYGPDEFRKLARDKVNVKEFEGNTKLNPEKSKLELINILLHMGTESNQDYVENFGVSRDTMKAVLENHLTKKDFDFVQSIWDRLKVHQNDLQILEVGTKGTKLEFIEPKPFKAFDTEYAGGYFPVFLKQDRLARVKQKMQGFWENSVAGKKAPAPINDALFGMVKSPHTEVRKGSDLLLDISSPIIAMAFDQVHHDLEMRIPVRDATVLLNHPEVEKGLKSVLGKRRYNNLYSTVAALTNSVSVQNNILYGDTLSRISNVLDRVSNNSLMNYMLYSFTTVGANALAIPSISQKLGPSGARHLVAALTKYTAQLWKVKDAVELYSDIDSTLKTRRNGVDDQVSMTAYRMLPKDRLIKGETYDWAKRTQEAGWDLFFHSILGGLDNMVTVISIEAAINQFLAGDAPGFPSKDIAHLSDDVKQKMAKEYAVGVANTTTMKARPSDKAIIQQTPILREGARVFSEARNVVNNKFQAWRDIKDSREKAIRYAKAGNYEAARSANFDTGTKIMWLMLMSAATYGMKKSISRQSGKDEDDVLSDVLGISLEASGLAEFPGVNSLKYALRAGKGPSLPVLQATGDAATAAVALWKKTAYDLGLVKTAYRLEEKDFRALWRTTGTVFGGLPVNLYYDVSNIKDSSNAGLLALAGLGFVFDQANSFIEDFSAPAEQSDEELLKELESLPDKEGDVAIPKTEIEHVVKDAKEMFKQPTVTVSDEPIGEEQRKIIMYAESGGNWRAKSSAGAAGIYQFTKTTWRSIVDSPEGKAFGLTMEHRTYKDPKYQEKAMQILTNSNIRDLKREGVPVNLTTVYFAHHFGTDRAPDFFKVKPSKPIDPEKTFTTDELLYNPKLKKMTKVSDMIEYLNNAIENGKKQYARQVNRG